VRPVGEGSDAVGHVLQIERDDLERSNQPDDRTLRVEIVPPDAHLRKYGKKRTGDHLELLARQLVERKPLTEDPSRREATGRGLVHLSRVEAARGGVPGDEEIGNDDVEARSGGRQVASAIVDDQ